MTLKRVSTFTILKMFYPYLRRVPLNLWCFSFRKFRNERPHWFNGQVRVNSLLPPYPSEAFDRFVDIIIKRRRIPHSIYLAVTSACPYRCLHCSYGRRKKGKLTTKQMLKLIGEIKELGTAIVGITGGEPMLRNDLEKIVAATTPQMTTVIFTTGYGLDKYRAEQIAETGVGCVTIGIESSNPKKHDKIRGKKGSFKESKTAVKNCNDAGIYTAIATIGMRDRIRSGELERIYELGRQWGVSEIRLIAPVATGFWTGCTDEMLRPDELQHLKEFHIKHNRTPDGPVVASFTYLESPEFFGCNAGYQNLYIDSMGEVCPCDLTPLSYGNVTQEPLIEIWERMGEYFPRPRLTCLMNEIAPDIKGDKLPVPPNESKKIVPPIDKDIPLPEVHRRISN